MSFRLRLIILGSVLTLIPCAAIALVVWFQNGRTLQATVTGCDKLALNSLAQIASGIYANCENSRALLDRRLTSNLASARHMLEREGGLHVSFVNARTWQATNQETKAAAPLTLPLLYIGAEAPDTADRFVQQVKQATGANCTLFQRMNAQGDMLRAATTVVTAEGKPATGTFIAQRMADGSENPVLAKVLKGEDYVGRARVAGNWNATAYSPIKDASGAVTGVLFVGIPEADASESLRKVILATRIAQTGYVYVLNAKGPTAGHYLISDQGKRDGENVSDVRDADGRPIIQEILQRALSLGPGEEALIHYSWKNPNDPAPRQRVVALRYFAPWDWVIGASVPVEEYRATAADLEQIANHGTRATFVVITASLGLAVLVWFLVASRWTRHVLSTVAHMRDAAAQVSSASAVVADTSQSLAQSAHEQASITHQVTDNVAAITKKSAAGAERSSEMRQAAAESRASASRGAAATTELAAAMKAIETSGRSVSGVLNVINEIAMQTNLLALNAAVEAARAGAAGAGFAVVADGVRSLAGRCAEASGETGRLIDQALVSTRQGSQFTGETQSSLAEIDQRSAHLDEIVAAIAEHAREQASLLQQIHTSMAEISHASQQSLASTEQSASAAEELSAQAEALQDASHDLELMFAGRAAR